MKNNKALPILGVGPIYMLSCLTLTIVGILFQKIGLIKQITITNDLIAIFIGIALIILGIFIWSQAVIFQRIVKEIRSGSLVTNGIYAYVRHPIYSAFLFIFTGILIAFNNLLLLILPLIFWIYLTVLIKATEERWLESKFGDEYISYAKKVNRVIPWFPKI